MAKKSDQSKENDEPKPDEQVQEPLATPVAGETKVADLADTLAAEMPEVQQHVVDAATKETPQNGAATPEPAPPVKRGRGRPPGSGAKSKVGTVPKSNPAGNVANTAQPDQTAAITMSAGMLTSVTIMAAVMIGGSDFQPAPNPLAGGKNDAEFLNAAYFDYCKAKGVQDIPPGVALCAALMVYVAPRLQKEQTQSRLQKLGGFVVGAWRKFRKRGDNAARPIGGNDGKRENDAKQEARE